MSLRMLHLCCNILGPKSTLGLAKRCWGDAFHLQRCLVSIVFIQCLILYSIYFQLCDPNTDESSFPFIFQLCHLPPLFVPAWFNCHGNNRRGKPLLCRKWNSSTAHDSKPQMSQNRSNRVSESYDRAGFWWSPVWRDQSERMMWWWNIKPQKTFIPRPWQDGEVGHALVSCGKPYRAQMCVTRSPGTASFNRKAGLSLFALTQCLVAIDQDPDRPANSA